MKAALDATPLILSSGGLTRYTQELGRALASEFPEDEFVLLSDQPFDPPSRSPGNLRSPDRPKGPLDRWWWLIGVQRAMSGARCDLFHGTNFAVPWAPLRPSVVTIHDLSPWLDPGWHTGAGFVRRRTPPQLGLGLATMIITPTEAIRRQAIDRFQIHPARITAVPLAADHLRPAKAKPWPAPYFVFVGTLEPRKNLGMLLDAWREVYSRHGAHLVLAGQRREDLTLPLAPEPGLHLLGEVADEDLAALYTGAAAMVYPSLYEGFGLPVLEAMQCGALVIASRDAAIREVAGDAAILLDAEDRRSWVEAMSAAVERPACTDSLRARSLTRARSFSWARTAHRTMEVYVEALGRWEG
jgi:glycosyltransferase involved in cell wall biosynthesis